MNSYTIITYNIYQHEFTCACIHDSLHNIYILSQFQEAPLECLYQKNTCYSYMYAPYKQLKPRTFGSESSSRFIEEIFIASIMLKMPKMQMVDNFHRAQVFVHFIEVSYP